MIRRLPSRSSREAIRTSRMEARGIRNLPITRWTDRNPSPIEYPVGDHANATASIATNTMPTAMLAVARPRIANITQTTVEMVFAAESYETVNDALAGEAMGFTSVSPSSQPADGSLH